MVDLNPGSRCVQCHEFLTIAGIITQTIHSLTAAIVTVLTAIQLVNTPRLNRNNNSIRCSLAILGMNAANSTWAILLFYEDRLRIFTTYGFLIYFLSAMNPLILIVASSQIKTFLRKVLFKSSTRDILDLVKHGFKVRPPIEVSLNTVSRGG